MHIWTDETLPGLFISPPHDLSAIEIGKLPKPLSAAVKKLRTCPGNFQFILINLEKVKCERQLLSKFLETAVIPFIHAGQVHTFFIRPSDLSTRKILVDALLAVPSLNLHVHDNMQEILTQVNYIKNLSMDGTKLMKKSRTPFLQRVRDLVRDTIM